MNVSFPRTSLALMAAVAALTSAACTDNNASKESAKGAIEVTSTEEACELSATTAESGNLAFEVTNKGSRVTEFYLLGEDRLRIVGEVENIGPGITRRLVLTAPPGKYATACKPGMTGDGIQAAFTVTDSGKPLAPDGKVGDLLDQASTQYVAYVRDQVQQLVTATSAFADAYKAGRDDEARSMYAPARVHWERIEPVAESFGDLDPRMDLREADLEPDQQWTGWHRIEKDLWPPASGYTALTPAERATVADQLVADTAELSSRVQTLELTPDKLGNGAKELLDEVATGKVTGEEETWSHTDLWDFQANVDGARVAFENLQAVVEIKEPKLATTLTRRFGEVQTLLDRYREGDGFITYDKLTPPQVKELSDAVNALAEPLSRLTEVVVS